MTTKEECLKKLSKIGKEAFKVMECFPKARSNKYELLCCYWRCHVFTPSRYMNDNTMELDIEQGKLNIEAIFTAQRQIWKFYPHWKKNKKETQTKHEAYKEHKLTNPVQGDLF